MARKSLEQKEILIETNQTLTETDVLTKEELKEEKKQLSHFIKIEPCHSDLFNGPIMFQNTRLILRTLKTRDKGYNIPLYPDIQKFMKEYPTVSRMFIRDGKWNIEEIERFQVVIPNTGKTLDISKEYDKFEYEFLKTYPEIGTEKKPINRFQKFYIINTEEKAYDTTSKYNIKKQAYKQYEELSVEDKLLINSYLGKNTVNISNQVLESNILEYIETKPNEFLDLIKKIETVRDYGLIGLLLEREILKRDGNAIYYGDMRLGIEIKDVVSYLNRPNNHDLKIMLRQKLNF